MSSSATRAPKRRAKSQRRTATASLSTVPPRAASRSLAPSIRGPWVGKEDPVFEPIKRFLGKKVKSPASRKKNVARKMKPKARVMKRARTATMKTNPG